LKNKAIRLIKWPKARSENLLISPGHKGRIREEAIRNYLRIDRQKPPCPLNITPLLFAFDRSEGLTIMDRNQQ